jgi:hypothetical protein
MNDDGIIITETTSEDCRTYTHTFSFPTSLEQTTVKVESKRGVPKRKGILKTHCTTIPMVSPLILGVMGKPVTKLIEKTSLTQSESQFVPYIVN